MSFQITRLFEATKPEFFTWAIEEIKSFREYLVKCEVDTFRSYSKSFTALQYSWYTFLSQKLSENDFQNGKTEENSIEKRPKAHFWWALYAASPAHYRPYYDHHCSSKERQEQMLNLLDDLIKSVQEGAMNF
jgi:hypothetical protein